MKPCLPSLSLVRRCRPAEIVDIDNANWRA